MVFSVSFTAINIWPEASGNVMKSSDKVVRKHHPNSENGKLYKRKKKNSKTSRQKIMLDLEEAKGVYA